MDDDFLAAYQASYGLPGSESVAAAPNGGGGANIGAASLEKDSSGFLVPPMPSSKVKLYNFWRYACSSI